jgi:hypothetical protein
MLELCSNAMFSYNFEIGLYFTLDICTRVLLWAIFATFYMQKMRSKAILCIL